MKVWLCALAFVCWASLGWSHGENWAVLVGASRDWRNYRHIANALSLYRTVKRLGIPDRQILFMMADDIACNSRNAFPAAVFNEKSHSVDLYGAHIEVDYRGYEVTVENFIRVLTGRHDAAVPRSKRLLSDQDSRILIYITGHGGDGFLRFQNQQDILTKDLAHALAQMYAKGRYGEVLLMVDTCQAATLLDEIDAPNVLLLASSLKGENSYSYHTDPVVGVSLIDRFTLATLRFFEGITRHSAATLDTLIQRYTAKELWSTAYYSTENFNRSLSAVLVTDFFGHVPTAQALQETMIMKKTQ